MIGGDVIETITCAEGVWINTREVLPGDEELSQKERGSRSECAILVERTDKARSVSDGDFVWWQGDLAFWTPESFKPVGGKRPAGLKVGLHYDIKMKKIGFTGMPRPGNVATPTPITK